MSRLARRPIPGAYIAGQPTLGLAVSFWGSVIMAGLIPVLTYFVTRQLQLGTAAFVVGAASAGVVTYVTAATSRAERPA